MNRPYAFQPRPRDAGISIPVGRVLLSQTLSRGRGGPLYRAVAVVEDEAGGEEAVELRVPHLEEALRIELDEGRAGEVVRTAAEVHVVGSVPAAAEDDGIASQGLVAGEAAAPARVPRNGGARGSNGDFVFLGDVVTSARRRFRLPHCPQPYGG
jgi:hypothetical protein